jgi:DnaJ-class molecular chaperone
MHKDVKEAFCDGSIQTESKGSQMIVEGKEQEVNCQIIRAEDDEEQINEEENTLACFKCEGTQVNRKGLPCRKCNGTGKLHSTFYKGLMKVLKDEVKSFTTQTF